MLWRMQALAEGDLSQRVAELAPDADLQLNHAKTKQHPNDSAGTHQRSGTESIRAPRAAQR